MIVGFFCLNLINAYVNRANTTTKIVPVTAYTMSDRSKTQRAGEEAGEKIEVGLIGLCASARRVPLVA